MKPTPPSLWALSAMALPLAFVSLPLYVLLPNRYAAQLGVSLASIGALLLAVRALDALLEGLGQSIRCMVSMVVPQPELVQRLLLRGKDSGRADDQNEDIIAQRIEEYQAKTAPVAQYYAHQNKWKEVDGIGSIEEIYTRIREAVGC